MKIVFFNLYILLFMVPLSAREPNPVVWNTPSENSSGSMPIGNGDIALSVWAQKDGTIRTYLAKTDAWDGAGRLLRLGGLDIAFSPNPFAGAEFTQTLDPAAGVITFTGADGFQAKVWVDANAPVTRVEMEAPNGVAVAVTANLWRREKREIPPTELMGYSWYMGGADAMGGIYTAPEPVYSFPDLVPSLEGNRIGWYQRNETSFWEFGFEHQQMGGPPPGEVDPLLHRTFGVLLESPQLNKMSPERLESSAPVKRFRLDVVALTKITPTAEAWLGEASSLLTKSVSSDLAAAWQAHQQWWKEFWSRSFVNFIKAPAPPAPVVAVTTNPFYIGIDSGKTSGLIGTIARARVYSRALQASEISELASKVPGDLVADWDFKDYNGGQVVDAVGGLVAQPEGSPAGEVVEATSGARLDGTGGFRVDTTPRLDLTSGGTLEVFVWSGVQGANGGRLFDKITPSTANGYLFDTYPGNSLRLITASGALEASSGFPAGGWQRLVATFDQRGRKIYRDGELIAEDSPDATNESLASSLNEAYGLQRYLSACAGRGAFPIRFNGSLFWGERQNVLGGDPVDPDWRMWAADYWWQNTRLPYYPMLASGDYEMMRPLFEMYFHRLPTEIARTKAWFGCEGAFMGETASFWGMMSNGDYGYVRPPELEVGELKNGVMRYYWQPGLELTFMMLDYYEHTGDEKFLRERIAPMAEAYLKYYATRFERDGAGKMLITPAQSLETWADTVNPTPDVAGITQITKRLLALPQGAIPQSLHDLAGELSRAVPPIPFREVEGKRVIGFAEEVRCDRSNFENPELYPVYPYRLFGLGRPDLELAKDTYDARISKEFFGWHQTGMQAACLGMADECAVIVASNLKNKNPNFRFPIMWGPNYDWVPDQDHGSNLINTIQQMLLQSDGEKIFLAPAWPKDWEVDFKLHAPKNTTVEASIRSGKIENLIVTPKEREKDIVNCLAGPP